VAVTGYALCLGDALVTAIANARIRSQDPENVLSPSIQCLTQLIRLPRAPVVLFFFSFAILYLRSSIVVSNTSLNPYSDML
jgi:hypothetical protein